jgi:protein-L-isoaspartate(D-aspartate) O-methyltransferase
MRWLRRPSAETDETDELARARERMVTHQIEARGLRDPELLRAFRSVLRDRFVASELAYGDQALPIEAGQTISQPFIVAYMTDAARPGRAEGWHGARALDIGTGSGYQAAILAELGAQVTSVERYPELSGTARRALEGAGYLEVELVVGDGSVGYPPNAPYDAIVVAAAAPSVPAPLLEQLHPEGGRLVIPIGTRTHQQLTVVERRGDDFHSRTREPVVFVPLVGQHGFPS